MAQTPSAAWTKAFSSEAVEPRFLVDIYDGTTHYYCTDKPCDQLSYDVAISEVKSLSAELDPMTREVKTSMLNIVVDDKWLRPIVTGTRLLQQQITVKIGAKNLAAGDFLGYFAGVINAVNPIGGAYEIECLNGVGYINWYTLADDWFNQHPLDIITDIMASADLMSASIDATSFDPANYSGSIGHFCRTIPKDPNATGATALMGGQYMREEVPAMELINQLCMILDGQVTVDATDKFKFSLFDSTAAAADHWDESVFANFKQKTGDMINQIVTDASIVLNLPDGQTNLEKTYTANDDTSQATYSYPGEPRRILSERLDSFWISKNSEPSLAVSIDNSITTIVLNAPYGMCGCNVESGSIPAWARPSVSQPVYLLIESEIIAITSVGTLSDDAYLDSGLYFKSYPLSITFTGVTRGALSTTPAAHSDEALSALNVKDITIAQRAISNRLERYADGLQLVELETPLSKAWLGLGDLVTLEYDQYSAYGIDGITSSDGKFEIVGREPSYNENMIKWVLAYAGLSSTSETVETAVRVGADSFAVFSHLESVFTRYYVSSGLLVSDGGGLTIDVSAGWLTNGKNILMLREAISGETISASKDTYVYFDKKYNTITTKETAIGAGEPTLGTTDFHLAKVTTNADPPGTIASVDTSGRITTGLDGDKLIDDTVDTAQLAPLAVTAAELGALSVTEAKIAALAVTNGKLGASAVTSGKLADDAVIEDKILDANITTRKVAGNNITAGKINRDLERTPGLCNGNFTDWESDSAFPPSAWKMDGGTWGTDASRETTLIKSGSYGLRFVSTLTTPINILSITDAGVLGGGYFQLEQGAAYRLSGLIRADSIAAGKNVQVFFKIVNAAYVAQTTITVHDAVAGAVVDTWYYVEKYFNCTNAAYQWGYFDMGRSGASFNAYIDRVDIRRVRHSFRAYLATAQNSVKGSFTKIDLDDLYLIADGDDHNIGAGFDATANNRFDVQRPGLYTFAGSARVESIADATFVAAGIYVDGSRVEEGAVNYNQTGGAFNVVCKVNYGPVWLDAGQYVELWVYSSDNATAISTGDDYTWLSGVEIEN